MLSARELAQSGWAVMLVGLASGEPRREPVEPVGEGRSRSFGYAAPAIKSKGWRNGSSGTILSYVLLLKAAFKGSEQVMCGINGIFAYNPCAGIPTDTELLATREAMRARGPDGAGAWWSGDRRCGLGHRRLAILDLSERAVQPMASGDGRYVVTFNGEIYNYPSLRKELEAEGVVFRSTSDTEVLLHLFARDGATMVHRLRGMYAFAIWDSIARRLFLARDPYGIKPLYTANDGWTFRFASQVKALLAGGAVSRDPEPAGLVGFHLFGSVPEPFTLYREIRALPAGHSQWVDAAGPREPEPFARLAAILADGARKAAPASELRERVRVGVSDSVRAHLLADVEVGIFLSAGVDSGSLLGLMRDAGQSNIRAITLAFEEFAGSHEDEAPLAARVARHYGASHVVRRVGKKEFDDDLPAIFDAMDQPSIDGVNTWFVSKAAKEAGLKVALSGLGGDELLAGYPSFLDLPRWRRRFGPLAAVPGLGRLARGLALTFAPRLGALQSKGARPARPRLELGGCLFVAPWAVSAARAHAGHGCRRRARRLAPLAAAQASVGKSCARSGQRYRACRGARVDAVHA